MAVAATDPGCGFPRAQRHESSWNAKAIGYNGALTMPVAGRSREPVVREFQVRPMIHRLNRALLGCRILRIVARHYEFRKSGIASSQVTEIDS